MTLREQVELAQRPINYMMTATQQEQIRAECDDAQTRRQERKHLWECVHPYRCSTANHYSGECTYRYRSWADFMAEHGNADLDLNLVFRWDWYESEDHSGSEYAGDPYYRNGRLVLFTINQQKGIFYTTLVEVCRADEPSVIAYLRPRHQKTLLLWEPL